MSELLTQQCKNLSADEPTLDDAAVSKLLLQLEPLWTVDASNKTISHRYDFKNYYQTMAFVNVIAQIAHQQDHHPKMLINYNHCVVSYSTHSIGGLSMNDFICAAKINAAVKL